MVVDCSVVANVVVRDGLVWVVGLLDDSAVTVGFGVVVELVFGVVAVESSNNGEVNVGQAAHVVGGQNLLHSESVHPQDTLHRQMVGCIGGSSCRLYRLCECFPKIFDVIQN